MSETKTISRRTRSLGYGWSNTPSGNGTDITLPTEPTAGGWSAILEEQEDCRRINSGGTYYSERLFLGDRPIFGHASMVLIELGMLRSGETMVVSFDDE